MGLALVKDYQTNLKEITQDKNSPGPEKKLNEFGLWIDENWKSFIEQNRMVEQNQAPTLYKGNVKYKECEVDGIFGTWVFYHCMECQDMGRCEIITYQGEKFRDKGLNRTFTSYNRYFSHWKRFIGEDPKTGAFPPEFNDYTVTREPCKCKKGEEIRKWEEKKNQS